MPRLVVVVPITPLHLGDSFLVSKWPLHITVLAPFLTDAEPGQIAAVLAAATSTTPSMTVIAGSDALFGRQEDVPVTLIIDSPDLSRSLPISPG